MVAHWHLRRPTFTGTATSVLEAALTWIVSRRSPLGEYCSREQLA